MKIYMKTASNAVIYCVKTKSPKLCGKNAFGWDSLHTKIDDTDMKFFFTVKNNSSYFYFLLGNQWYKTDIISKEGLDLYNYIYNNSGEFSKEK